MIYIYNSRGRVLCEHYDSDLNLSSFSFERIDTIKHKDIIPVNFTKFKNALGFLVFNVHLNKDDLIVLKSDKTGKQRKYLINKSLPQKQTDFFDCLCKC